MSSHRCSIFSHNINIIDQLTFHSLQNQYFMKLLRSLISIHLHLLHRAHNAIIIQSNTVQSFQSLIAVWWCVNSLRDVLLLLLHLVWNYHIWLRLHLLLNNLNISWFSLNLLELLLLLLKNLLRVIPLKVDLLIQIGNLCWLLLECT